MDRHRSNCRNGKEKVLLIVWLLSYQQQNSTQSFTVPIQYTHVTYNSIHLAPLTHPAAGRGSDSLSVEVRWQGVQCQSCEAGEAALPDD